MGALISFVKWTASVGHVVVFMAKFELQQRQALRSSLEFFLTFFTFVFIILFVGLFIYLFSFLKIEVKLTYPILLVSGTQGKDLLFVFTAK